MSSVFKPAQPEDTRYRDLCVAGAPLTLKDFDKQTGEPTVCGQPGAHLRGYCESRAESSSSSSSWPESSAESSSSVNSSSESIPWIESANEYVCLPPKPKRWQLYDESFTGTVSGAKPPYNAEGMPQCMPMKDTRYISADDYKSVKDGGQNEPNVAFAYLLNRNNAPYFTMGTPEADVYSQTNYNQQAKFWVNGISGCPDILEFPNGEAPPLTQGNFAEFADYQNFRMNWCASQFILQHAKNLWFDLEVPGISGDDPLEKTHPDKAIVNNCQPLTGGLQAFREQYQHRKNPRMLTRDPFGIFNKVYGQKPYDIMDMGCAPMPDSVGGSDFYTLGANFGIHDSELDYNLGCYLQKDWNALMTGHPGGYKLKNRYQTRAPDFNITCGRYFYPIVTNPGPPPTLNPILYPPTAPSPMVDGSTEFCGGIGNSPPPAPPDGCGWLDVTGPYYGLNGPFVFQQRYVLQCNAPHCDAAPPPSLPPGSAPWSEPFPDASPTPANCTTTPTGAPVCSPPDAPGPVPGAPGCTYFSSAWSGFSLGSPPPLAVWCPVGAPTGGCPSIPMNGEELIICPSSTLAPGCSFTIHQGKIRKDCPAVAPAPTPYSATPVGAPPFCGIWGLSTNGSPGGVWKTCAKPITCPVPWPTMVTPTPTPGILNYPKEETFSWGGSGCSNVEKIILPTNPFAPRDDVATVDSPPASSTPPRPLTDRDYSSATEQQVKVPWLEQPNTCGALPVCHPDASYTGYTDYNDRTPADQQAHPEVQCAIVPVDILNFRKDAWDSCIMSRIETNYAAFIKYIIANDTTILRGGSNDLSTAGQGFVPPCATKYWEYDDAINCPTSTSIQQCCHIIVKDVVPANHLKMRTCEGLLEKRIADVMPGGKPIAPPDAAPENQAACPAPSPESSSSAPDNDFSGFAPQPESACDAKPLKPALPPPPPPPATCVIVKQGSKTYVPGFMGGIGGNAPVYMYHEVISYGNPTPVKMLWAYHNNRGGMLVRDKCDDVTLSGATFDIGYNEACGKAVKGFQPGFYPRLPSWWSGGYKPPRGLYGLATEGLGVTYPVWPPTKPVNPGHLMTPTEFNYWIDFLASEAVCYSNGVCLYTICPGPDSGPWASGDTKPFGWTGGCITPSNKGAYESAYADYYNNSTTTIALHYYNYEVDHYQDEKDAFKQREQHALDNINQAYATLAARVAAKNLTCDGTEPPDYTFAYWFGGDIATDASGIGAPPISAYPDSPVESVSSAPDSTVPNSFSEAPSYSAEAQVDFFGDAAPSPTFIGYHMPYMRWWDTGASAGNVYHGGNFENTLGSYDTIVGEGREERDTFAAFDATREAKTNMDYFAPSPVPMPSGPLTPALKKKIAAVNEYNKYAAFTVKQLSKAHPSEIGRENGWMGLVMDQMWSIREHNLYCLPRYEKEFKPGGQEDPVLNKAGSSFTNRQNDPAHSWPLSWRGYVTDTHLRGFPYDFKIGTGSTWPITGFNNVLPGDIVSYSINGLAHIGYVKDISNFVLVGDQTDTPISGDQPMQWDPAVGQYRLLSDNKAVYPTSMTVLEWDQGKFPSSTGVSNDWGVPRAITIYKSAVPEAEQAVVCKMPLRALTDYTTDENPIAATHCDTVLNSVADAAANFNLCMPQKYPDKKGNTINNASGLNCQPSCEDPYARTCVLPGGVVDWNNGLIYRPTDPSTVRECIGPEGAPPPITYNGKPVGINSEAPPFDLHKTYHWHVSDSAPSPSPAPFNPPKPESAPENALAVHQQILFQNLMQRVDSNLWGYCVNAGFDPPLLYRPKVGYNGPGAGLITKDYLCGPKWYGCNASFQTKWVHLAPWTWTQAWLTKKGKWDLPIIDKQAYNVPCVFSYGSPLPSTDHPPSEAEWEAACYDMTQYIQHHGGYQFYPEGAAVPPPPAYRPAPSPAAPTPTPTPTPTPPTPGFNPPSSPTAPTPTGF